jgi:hypothetical protein
VAVLFAPLLGVWALKKPRTKHSNAHPGAYGAAILGMIPIAPTIFWGPMAYAIMGGLAVATLLTLVFLPALYVTWFRIKSPHQDTCQRVDTEQTELAVQRPEARR